jgi:integrase
VVRVHGKGNKVREVPIKGGTLEAIRAWLSHRNAEPGPLVCPVGKSGRVSLQRVAPQTILRVCEKRAKDARIPGFVAHDLRRSYISALLDQGVDLSALRRFVWVAKVAGRPEKKVWRAERGVFP